MLELDGHKKIYLVAEKTTRWLPMKRLPWSLVQYSHTPGAWVGTATPGEQPCQSYANPTPILMPWLRPPPNRTWLGLGLGLGFVSGFGLG